MLKYKRLFYIGGIIMADTETPSVTPSVSETPKKRNDVDFNDIKF